ncbi:hypothetical protein Cob_v006989 [Colletotrichum orbiculare MAFF 240422]|uniref:Uncharacterized protein n=1 Tax=Colletotrichum orbiculare (strain 104-T / ATCC 96160 / CBS 514.97 / LARS 414 / MAFF 240422) TaxID=1213857 RepID=N4VX95_COLOR|nr:hypothetical protein Cob_v006989 [Colletotrichum orbiculare MAFF 240422]
MSSSRRSGGSHHHRSSKSSSSSSKKSKSVQNSNQQLIESLETHRVNTLTGLCRIERVAATCDEDEAAAFNGPMTSAWNYYVNSNQLLSEMRGLTPNYPLCAEIIYDAQALVHDDPESNRSWNLAWLILDKIEKQDMVRSYAAAEAAKLEMWGGREPTAQEAGQLAQCFEYEWNQAMNKMLRHWAVPPCWY